ncbi:MAG: DinB family protein [bacterium]
MSEPTTEQLARVGAWIRSEAASKSVDETHSYVLERLDRLYACVADLATGQLTAVSASEGWAPLDALRHVVEWNWQVGEDILHMCLTGERPGNPIPEFPADREALVARQKESIESVYAHVSAADPESFLAFTWEHPFFGMLNWREWFLFLGVHTSDHTAQIKAMLANG